MIDVTIVIPCYGRQKLLDRACLNALEQQGVSLELIVVDDASPEPLTLATGDPRAKLLRSETNRGPSGARNIAVAKAQGKWIALLDCDDFWEPDKLSRQVAFAEQNGLSACGTGYVLDFGSRHRPRVVLPAPPADARDVLVNGNRFGLGSTLLAKRSLLLSEGRFDERLRRHEDTEWLLRLMRREKFGVLADPLVHVSAIPVSATHAPGESFASSIEAFHRLAASEYARLTEHERKFVYALEHDWMAWAYFRERNWRSGLKHLGQSLALRPIRGPGNVISYVESMTGLDLSVPLTTLRERMKGR